MNDQTQAINIPACQHCGAQSWSVPTHVSGAAFVHLQQRSSDEHDTSEQIFGTIDPASLQVAPAEWTEAFCDMCGSNLEDPPAQSTAPRTPNETLNTMIAAFTEDDWLVRIHPPARYRAWAGGSATNFYSGSGGTDADG